MIFEAKIVSLDRQINLNYDSFGPRGGEEPNRINKSLQLIS